MPRTPPDILTAKQAARYLQVALITIYRWAEQGAIPGQKIGGSWRFSRAALEAHIRGPHLSPEAAQAIAQVLPNGHVLKAARRT